MPTTAAGVAPAGSHLVARLSHAPRETNDPLPGTGAAIRCVWTPRPAPAQTACVVALCGSARRLEMTTVAAAPSPRFAGRLPLARSTYRRRYSPGEPASRRLVHRPADACQQRG